jgi:hypothetical protein
MTGVYQMAANRASYVTRTYKSYFHNESPSFALLSSVSNTSILAVRFVDSLVDASGLYLRHTAISRQVNAGDEAAIVLSDEQNRRRHFFNAAHSSKGDHLCILRFQSVDLLL